MLTLCHVTQFGADINWSNADQNNQTALHIAVIHSNHSLIHFLLQQRADATFQDSDKGWTPLHFAVSKNDSTCVEMLLKAAPGAVTIRSVNKKNKHSGFDVYHQKKKKIYI